MEISLNLGVWNSVFAVPSVLVDEHIKLAGGAQLKVLLWLLRHAGTPVQVESIGKALNMQPLDVKDAVNYWVETGLLALSGDTLSPVGSVPQEPQKPEETEEPAAQQPLEPSEPQEVAQTARVSISPPRPSGVFLAQRIQESEEIAFLMQEAQRILGRTISPALSGILLSAVDDYGIPAGVVAMVLTYVKNLGKTNSSYIEAILRGWAQDGITTHEKAEEKLKLLSEIGQAWRDIEQTFGIEHRIPSAREEEFAQRWMLEWKFTVPMLREAYDRCVDSIGKLELKYIDRILERWHKDGITTPQQAFWEKSEKEAQRRAEADAKRTYDIQAYEKFDFLEAELPGGGS